MGLHNRITEDKYNKIKKYINSKKAVKELRVLDNAVVEAFGIGLSSARNIRLTDNYQAYCERVFRFHGHPGKKAKPAAKEAQPEELGNDFYNHAIFAAVCRLENKMELAADDQQLMIENQIELNKKLRAYVILDGILIGVMLALLIMAIIGRVYGN